MEHPLRFGNLGLHLAILLLIAACASSTTEEPATTTGPAAPTTTTPEPASTTAPPTTLPGAAEQSFDFVVPFTITVPSDLRLAQDSGSRLLYLERDENLLVFSTFGAATVTEWRVKLTENVNLVSSEPTPVEIDGAEGFWVDVTVSDEASTTGCPGQGGCATLIEQFPGWFVIEDFPNRIWVVDVGGTPVFIAAESSEEGFEEFVAEVEEVLSTLRWGREA